MLSESHFPEMWTDFFSHSCIRITVRASDFLLHSAKIMQIDLNTTSSLGCFAEMPLIFYKGTTFSRFCKSLLNFLLFFNIFFIIHTVYFTISNYP